MMMKLSAVVSVVSSMVVFAGCGKSPQDVAASGGVTGEIQQALAQCQLDAPVSLQGKDPQHETVTLFPVRLAQPPKTESLRSGAGFGYGLQLFPVVPTGRVGMRIVSYDELSHRLTNEQVGFPDEYIGEVSFEGHQQIQGRTTLHQLKVGDKEARVVIRDGQLLSAQLTQPLDPRHVEEMCVKSVDAQ